MAADLESHGSILLPGLRNATKSVHQQIERQPTMARLMAHDLQLHEYAQVLLGFTLFFQKLEPEIIAQLNGYAAENTGNQSNYTYTPRLPLLSADLEVVEGKMELSMANGDLPSSIQRRSPQLTSAPPGIENVVWPAITNRWQLLAVLYVLEGSSQGGEILSPRVSRTLALNGTGCKYFNLSDNGTNSWIQWQEWCKQVEWQESKSAVKAHQDSVFLTAEQTFIAIAKCMDIVSASFENQ